MGVSYYECAGCSFGYRDDSEYVRHCDCGSGFCSFECGELTNCGEWNDDNMSYHIDPEKDMTCKICRKEAENDYVLLQALLKHFNITREEAFEIYKNQKE